MDTVATTNIPSKDSTVMSLNALKQKADTLGIIYNPRIGIVKLQDKINQFLAEAEETETLRISAPETLSAKLARLRKEAAMLIRVRINCLNPAKRNWPGEIVSVGNGKIGTFKKFVPFNLEAGYHIPRIIYNFLVTRQFQSFYTVKGRNGKPDAKRSKLMREFNIEVLPDLTRKELDALIKEQAINHSIDE